MPSFIERVIPQVWENIRQGYYDVHRTVKPPTRPKLKDLAKSTHLPIIAEIKPRSPSVGTLIERADVGLALALEEAGASALSILVEKSFFAGSIELLCHVSEKAKIPVLFKDFVVSRRQVLAASMCGADVVLLIGELFRDGYTEASLDEMVELAHSQGLEVLLELHDPRLVETAVSSKAEYVGVNNRNLYTLELNPDHFYSLSSLLRGAKFRVAESGYSDCIQIVRDRKVGADAFLIGSALMGSVDPPKKLRELLGCGQN